MYNPKTTSEGVGSSQLSALNNTLHWSNTSTSWNENMTAYKGVALWYMGGVGDAASPYPPYYGTHTPVAPINTGLPHHPSPLWTPPLSASPALIAPQGGEAGAQTQDYSMSPYCTNGELMSGGYYTIEQNAFHLPTHLPSTAPQLPTHLPSSAPHLPTHLPFTAPQLPTHLPSNAPHLPTHLPSSAPHLLTHLPSSAPHLPTHLPSTAPQLPTHLPSSDPQLPTPFFHGRSFEKRETKQRSFIGQSSTNWPFGNQKSRGRSFGNQSASANSSGNQDFRKPSLFTARGKNRPRCVFCSQNGEEDVWHQFKDSEGHVMCPVLSAYTCRLCGATGIYAHTNKYCPLNKLTRGDPKTAGYPPGLMFPMVTMDDIE